MLTIGCHLSVAKGFLPMGKEASKINANTFQFFTRNPRGGRSKAIDKKDLEAFIVYLKENNFATLLAHAPYTLNPCSKDESIRQFAFEIMKEDLEKMELMPGNYYNFHPGSHTGQGVEVGIEQIATLLNKIIYPKQSTTILLETMAGKGTEVGSTFQELRAIIDKVEVKGKIGVCLDTCHVHDGGYDIVNNLDGVLKEFDKTIGISYLKAIHINDSLNEISAHKDRHAKIGEGKIGIAAMEGIINHKWLKDLPFYLETPNELDGYKAEIELLRGLYKHKKNME